MIFRTLLLAGGLVSTIAASPSDAGPIFPFAGSVSDCNGQACNRPFSGAFTVDPSVPDAFPGTPTAGGYANAGTIELTFDDTDYDGNATYFVFDNDPVFGNAIGRSEADGFFIDAALIDADNNDLDFIATLVGSDLDLFDDDALPTDVNQLAVASLDAANVTIQTGDETFQGEINEIPEAGTVVLLASGLAGLAAARRRRRD